MGRQEDTAARHAAWTVPAAIQTPGSGEVHVWRADLNVTPERLTLLRATLADDEMARANRFRFDVDRRRFVGRRGVLRAVLAQYVGTAPGTIRFRASPNGKPEIANGPGRPSLRFNLSHSHGRILVAVAHAREVGVDLERVIPDRAEPGIARRFFASREAAALDELSGPDRVEGFFNCWTRKEAFVKALGQGLSFPLDAFEVSLEPGRPAVLRHVRGSEAAATDWDLTDLDPWAGYAAALVVEGKLASLERWHWAARAMPRSSGRSRSNPTPGESG